MGKSSMKNQHNVEEWLKRARSNMARAKMGKLSEAILYEDLCFDCQQTVEKSLKGLLIHIGIGFPRIHSITRLIELIEEAGITVPEYVKDAITLTVYAVDARYPSNQESVEENEYQEAVEIAEKVYDWVKTELRRQG